MGDSANPSGADTNSSATPSLGFFNAGMVEPEGFGNSGSGLSLVQHKSCWAASRPSLPELRWSYLRLPNLGSGISVAANTGTPCRLPPCVTSLVSGLANIGNNLSGLFFQIPMAITVRTPPRESITSRNATIRSTTPATTFHNDENHRGINRFRLG